MSRLLSKVTRSRSSPIKTLPPEMLGEIFRLCLPNFPTGIPSAKIAPLLLCHVCQLWRKTAQGMSELWDGIWFENDPRFSARRNALRLASIASHWYQVSNLRREFFLRFDWNAGQAGLPPSNIVFPLRPNVNDLVIEVDHEQQLDALFQHPTHSMSSLQRVRIRATSWSVSGQQAIRYPILQPARNLYMLALDIPHFRLHDPTQLFFPWAQITHLCLERNVTLLGWHQIIRACCRLEELHATFHHIATPAGFDVHLVTLKHLRLLSLGFETTFIPALFHGVSMPSLDELAIINKDPSCGIPIGPIDPLSFRVFKQIAPGLTRLDLEQQEVQANDVLSILHHATCLEYLLLDIEGDHHGLLTALTIPANTPTNARILVPKLKFFGLALRRSFGRRGGREPILSATLYSQAMVSRYYRDLISKSPGIQIPSYLRFSAVLEVDSSYSSILQRIGTNVAAYQATGFGIQLNVKERDEDSVFRMSHYVWHNWRVEHGSRYHWEHSSRGGRSH